METLLAVSGIFPSANNNDNLLRISKIVVFLTISFGFYTLTLIYSIKYLHMMEAVQAAGYINNGVLCVGIGYASLMYNRKQLLKTISDWEQAINKRIRSKPSSQQIYINGIENISKTFKRMSFFYLCLTVSIFTTTVVVVPIVHLFYRNFDPSTWSMMRPCNIPVLHLSKIVIPFAEGSYLTFFGKNLTVFITTLCYYTIIASSMLILMSTTICYETCIDDVLDRRKLVDVIAYQNEINGHVEQMAEMLSGILFLSIMNAVTTMALALFYIEEEITEMSAHLVTSFDILLIQAIIGFIYCYFGSRITSKSGEISDAAYAMEWYRLEPRIRIIIKLIILRSQREIYISGSGFVVCSLEMYKKMIDTAMSYYLIVRSVSET